MRPDPGFILGLPVPVFFLNKYLVNPLSNIDGISRKENFFQILVLNGKGMTLRIQRNTQAGRYPRIFLPKLKLMRYIYYITYSTAFGGSPCNVISPLICHCEQAGYRHALQGTTSHEVIMGRFEKAFSNGPWDKYKILHWIRCCAMFHDWRCSQIQVFTYLTTLTKVFLGKFTSWKTSFANIMPLPQNQPNVEAYWRTDQSYRYYIREMTFASLV